MKERPILFSALMVRAILAGTKTQTRRIYKMRKHPDCGCEMAGTELRGERPDVIHRMCPYGLPGDRLWVRETWQGPLLGEDQQDEFLRDGPERFQAPEFCVYRATDKLDAVDMDGNELGWRPSIHMPRWSSRITLEVTGVRVERLQEISEEDAKAEGAPFELGELERLILGAKAKYRSGFVRLWESINGPGSWEINPWVWVVEFQRLAQPAQEGSSNG